MTVEHIKQMLDACYLAKRARDMLPPLPDGVQPSYIRYLDTIQKLQSQGRRVQGVGPERRAGAAAPRRDPHRKGDGSAGLPAKAGLGRGWPGDLSAAHRSGGAALPRVRRRLFPGAGPGARTASPDADAMCTIRTLEAFYQVMYERRNTLEK